MLTPRHWLKRALLSKRQVPCPWCSLPCPISSRLLSHQLSFFPPNISSYVPVKVVTVRLLDNKAKQNYKSANGRCLVVSFAPSSQLPLKGWSPLSFLPCVSSVSRCQSAHRASTFSPLALAPCSLISVSNTQEKGPSASSPFLFWPLLAKHFPHGFVWDTQMSQLITLIKAIPLSLWLWSPLLSTQATEICPVSPTHRYQPLPWPMTCDFLNPRTNWSSPYWIFLLHSLYLGKLFLKPLVLCSSCTFLPTFLKGWFPLVV